MRLTTNLEKYLNNISKALALLTNPSFIPKKAFIELLIEIRDMCDKSIQELINGK